MSGKTGAEKRFVKSRLLVSSAIVTCFAGFSSAAIAQDGPRIDTITVTAEKREESAQDVAIAITAQNQEMLDVKGITDFFLFQNQVPSLSLTYPQGVVQLTLRGAGNDTVTLGADNGVAFHYDGVYLGNANSGLTELWDVERVEVLRGPQGTLYGRNTTGGSINIIPKKPTNQFEGKGDFTYGNYDLRRIRGAVNIPLSDRIQTRWAFSDTKRDGYQENLVAGVGDADDKDSWTARGIINYDITDNVNLELSGTANEADDRAVSPVRPGPDHISGGPGGILGAVLAGALPKDPDPRVTRKDFGETNYSRFLGGAATLTWDFGSVTFKSISAYYDMDRRVNSDWDDTEISFVRLFTGDNSDQFSQEIQLYNNDSEKLEWIFGASYLDFDNRNNVFVDLRTIDAIPGPFFGTDLFQTIDATIDVKSYSVFGQASYYLTPQFRVTGGVRYSWDEKSTFSIIHPPVVPGPGPGGVVVPPPGFLLMFPQEESWAEPTGKVSLDWFIDDDRMVYASYSHGYKAGAINPSATMGIVDPEFADAIEVGLKSFFFDRRVQFNVAGFYTDYSDVQINTFPVTNSVLVNVPGAQVWGVEIDYIVLLSENLSLDGTFGYINSEYDTFISGNPAAPGPMGLTPVDIGGNQLINTPEVSLTIGGQYTYPTNIGDFSLRVDFGYRSETPFDIYGNADMIRDDFTKTDLRGTWTSKNGQFFISGWVQNLENDDVVATFNRPGSILGSNIPLAWYFPPRTYGVTVGANF